jgi:hypothetical protein
MHTPKVKSVSETPRFDVLPTSLGFEVIDRDGRPVAEHDEKWAAVKAVDELNQAARLGRSGLATALFSL